MYKYSDAPVQYFFEDFFGCAFPAFRHRFDSRDEKSLFRPVRRSRLHDHPAP
jgi:hypothetical protein